MNMNGKKGFAILLIALGALILLNKAGFLFGHFIGSLLGILFPLAMVFLGYIGIRNGNKFFGWVFAVIGSIILLGKMSGLIGLLIAIGFIVYGIGMLKKRTI